MTATDKGPKAHRAVGLVVEKEAGDCPSPRMAMDKGVVDVAVTFVDVVSANDVRAERSLRANTRPYRVDTYSERADVDGPRTAARSLTTARRTMEAPDEDVGLDGLPVAPAAVEGRPIMDTDSARLEAARGHVVIFFVLSVDHVRDVVCYRATKVRDHDAGPTATRAVTAADTGRVANTAAPTVVN